MSAFPNHASASQTTTAQDSAALKHQKEMAEQAQRLAGTLNVAHGLAPKDAQVPSAKNPGAQSRLVEKSPDKKFLTKEQRSALREKFNEVKLALVLEVLGAEPNQDRDRSKWKIHGKGNFITKGQSWKNVNTEKKGFGGVGLVRHALDFEYESAAIDWMVKHFGEVLDEDMKASLRDLSSVRKDFSPPDNDPSTIGAVRKYLVFDRGLPPSLIDAMIGEGKVYSDEKRNCVFISTSAAEVRSTSGPDFKGCCAGSQTDWSGFRVANEKLVSEKIISLVEAAIDALSYRALFPGRFVMSTNGSGRFMLQYRVVLEAIEHEYGISAAFDADWAGDLAAQKIFNALYVRTALSRQLKISEETLDEWFLEQQITFEVGNSPHESFFNTGWEALKPEFQSTTIKNAKGEDELIWVDANTMAPPTIRIQVAKDLHPGLNRGEKSIQVTERGYEYITQKLGLKRERPVKFKDWNDEMKNLGVTFVQEYERSVKAGFLQGVVKLPDYLERFRESEGGAPITYLAPEALDWKGLSAVIASDPHPATVSSLLPEGGDIPVSHFVSRNWRRSK